VVRAVLRWIWRSPHRTATDREEYLMMLLGFKTVKDLEAWINAPSDLPLEDRMREPEYEEEYEGDDQY
jgi:hypothetical protein